VERQFAIRIDFLRKYPMRASSAHSASIKRKHVQQCSEQCGFPGAVRTDDGQGLTGMQYGFRADAYPHGTVFSHPTTAVKSASATD
jgi:hypothetical protein